MGSCLFTSCRSCDLLIALLFFFGLGQHLPITAIVLSIVAWMTVGYGKELPLVLWGIFYGWLYLRFFKVDPDSLVVGDPRDDFSFASLFPSPLQYVYC